MRDRRRCYPYKHAIGPLASKPEARLGAGHTVPEVGSLRICATFEIRDGSQVVARISRKWFTIRDAYGVDVAPGQSDAFIIAIAVCLDRIHHDEEERRG